MKRLWRGVRSWPGHCLRPLLRSLRALGIIHTGLTEHHHALMEPAPPPPFRDPFGRAHGGLRPLTPGHGGPPPGHPERLCEHVPLSRQERRLAREVWPELYPEQSAPGGS